jgi:lipopolysaccharide/colanic/teichoic acid biosynthesis glycosyltransferase
LGKRLFDVAVSGIALLFLWPLFLVLAIAIKLDSKGTVFYKAERIGRHGEPFRMYKFRTMVANASEIGPSVTYLNDPRVTKLGRYLRDTKLDELPQLINVVKGDMSMVGPRPETDDHIALYNPEQREVLKVRPGITGLSQIACPNEESRIESAENLDRVYNDIMQGKLSLDLKYVMNGASMRKDLGILARTVPVILKSND